MKAMILSAGLGTRLRPITNSYAKPAVPFLNIPLLYYSVGLLQEAGVRDFVFNTHYKADQVESLAKEIPNFKGHVYISHEPGEPLGSGGGVWKAFPYLEGSDFFLANGDEVILPHNPTVLKSAIQAHKEQDALSTILVMRHPLVGTQFGGVWADQNGHVLGFGKDGSKFQSQSSIVTGFHYIGLQILSPRVFEYLPNGESNILYDALAAAIANGERVQILESDFTWFETGNPDDFLKATKESIQLLVALKSNADFGLSKSLNREAAEFLNRICQRYWEPGTELIIHDQPATALIQDPSSRISSDAVLKGSVVLGKNSVVEPGATIEDSVLLTEAVARSHSTTVHQILL